MTRQSFMRRNTPGRTPVDHVFNISKPAPFTSSFTFLPSPWLVQVDFVVVLQLPIYLTVFCDLRALSVETWPTFSMKKKKKHPCVQ